MATPAELKLARGRAKGSLTKVLHAMERALVDGEDTKMAAQLQEAKVRFDAFEKAHERYLETVKDELEKEDDYFEKEHDLYIKVVGQIKQKEKKTITPTATDLMTAMCLPRPELQVFDGNPADFHLWASNFKEVVHDSSLSNAGKMSRLMQYTRGKAQDAIKACALTAHGYERALQVLEERFGNDHLVTQSIIGALREGNPVRNPEQLRLLADELEMCINTLTRASTLSEVEGQGFILQVARRLPMYLQRRWKQEAVQAKTKTKSYPRLKDFQIFVANEASVETDPVYGSLGTPKPADSRKVTSHATDSVKKFKHVCPLCSSSHKLIMCAMFKGMSPSERLRFTQERKLCQVCLYQNHSTEDCRRPFVCSVEGCGGRHSPYIHVVEEGAISNSCKVGNKAAFIPTVKIKTCGKFAHAVLDTGSNASFVTRGFLDEIGLSGRPISLSLSTLHGAASKQSTVVDLKVESTDTSEQLLLSNVIVTEKIPITIPQVSTGSFKHLKGLSFAMPPRDTAQLLIGQDNAVALIPLDVKKGARDEPFAVRTLFGWSLNGPAKVPLKASKAVCHFVSAFQAPPDDQDGVDARLEEKMACWWTMHDDGFASDQKGPSMEDRQVLDLWERKCERVDGHFQVPIPWKPCVEMPNNRSVALHRLLSLQRNLVKRGLLDDYDKEIQKMIDKGYAEPCSEIPASVSAWYLPHHLVLNPKKPGKLRVVYDCAAKFAGQSLNDKCFSGPDLINRLIHVLLRFRQHPLAFTSDVEAMYYQVLIPPSDRDSLRFLWFNDTGHVVEYRMTRHLFGGIWCASSSTFALRKSIELFDSVSDQVKDTIMRSFYVDDCLRSASTAKSVHETAQKTIAVLANSGFKLTKFVSNSQELLDSIPPDQRAFGDKDIGPADQCNVLGIKWNVDSDEFRFQCAPESKEKISRRDMLRSVATMFDPLGLIAPVLVRGRIILQEATRLKLPWDEPVPQQLLNEWNEWQHEIECLNELHIPRCVKPFLNSISSLHHFCDASELAYGCCSYLRSIDPSGEVSVYLLFSKSRVTPLKKQTIPRLELQAALLATRADVMIRAELDLDLGESQFFCDSQIVLRYISNDSRRFQTFVANRVAQIRHVTEPSQWHFIPSEQNVADVISRGHAISSQDNNLWFSGPRFLSRNDLYSQTQTEQVDTSLDEDDHELKKSSAACITVFQDEHPIDVLCQHYSEWNQLKRAVAWLMRLKAMLKARCQTSTPGSTTVSHNGTPGTAKVSTATHDAPQPLELLTTYEIDHAERTIIMHVQSKYFSQELERLTSDRPLHASSSVRKLCPILADDGILRVGGRLRLTKATGFCTQQILIPHRSKIAPLIARHYHRQGHLGTEWVVSRIRTKFWITKARAVVKAVSADCVCCRKWFSEPMGQKMADLPPERLEPCKPPFTYTGLDCFGPFIVKRARSEIKRYCCLFTCFTTRAIHLELLDSLDTDSFLNAFRRFICRRGTPLKLWSDNGTNFVGGHREMIRACSNQLGIEWKFHPPHASHFGGVWERLIRTVRKVLTAVVPTGRLSDETLRTILCEAEFIVNSRPITKVSDDPRDGSALTPNHLLLLSECPPLPPGVFRETDVYRRRWRCVQHIANAFWEKWLREYIPELQKREKWLDAKRSLKVGDIVLMVEENSPRGVWPLGLVVETILSGDNVVRAATIRTQSSEFTRPIQKLVFVEGM